MKAGAVRQVARDGAVIPTDVVHPLAVLPADQRLLLLTAGDSDNDALIRETAGESVDWPRFFALAQIERAVPIIYPRLRALASDLVPADGLEQMRRLAQVSDFAMLHLEHRLRESVRALHENGVRTLLLKGAGLAFTVYPGPRQRPMSDIDMLVESSQAGEARRLMLATGWRESDDGPPDEVYLHHHHLPPLFDSRSRDLQLEIHTALFPERQPFAFDTADVWARARVIGATIPGALAPCSVHALLHTCLHFFWSHQARFGAWRTIRDVNALSRADDIDWQEFVALARAIRGGSSCYWTLRIAEITGGARIPEEILDALRPRRRAYSLHAIERHLVFNLLPVSDACPSVKLEHLLWEAAAMPRASGHGNLRPWDEDEKFMVASKRTATSDRSGLTYGANRFMAFARYIAMLLRARP